jgi:hypothetical protein
MRFLIWTMLAFTISACAVTPPQPQAEAENSGAAAGRSPASVSSASLPAFQCQVDGAVLRYITLNAKDVETAVTIAQVTAGTEDARLRQQNFKHPPATVEALGLRVICKKI